MENSLPNEEVIKNAVFSILQGCDLSTVTLKIIRTRLEEKFGCSFSEKKDVIREALEHFLTQKSEATEYDAIIESETNVDDGDRSNANLKKKRGGFGAPVQLSTELSEFVGADTMPRTEVTKYIWGYIKKHNLQNPADKREIMCDDALEKVLKKKTIHMFKMTKILSTMMKSMAELQSGIADISDDEDEEQIDHSKTKKRKKVTKASNSTKQKDKDSINKKAKCASNETTKKPTKASSSKYTISQSLAKLLGLATDDTRYQVVAKMWEYIRGNNLQDPADRRTIILDDPLQTVFKVKKFTIFTMNKYIAEQMIKND